MRNTWFLSVVLFIASVHPASSQVRRNADASIVWDPTTLVLVQPGGVYGRMVRLPNRQILCSFESNGAIFVRHSIDEGQTWEEPVQVASFAFGTAANPEMLVLLNGSI